MKKIAVVTGARAEYGLFYPLLKKIQASEMFQLQLIVTGMHLSPEFGLTYRQIEEDGFEISEKVEMLLSSDSEVGIGKSIGLGMIGFADAFKRLSPDLFVLLGDRFETFAAGTAAFIHKIPISHIHGGELTEGAIDDAFRHSITKMSLWHFASTEVYRRRIIQLGEEPDRVFNVGALGLDNINNLKLLTKEELEKELNFELGQNCILVTFHPVTLENNELEKHLFELFGALDYFEEVNYIFTMPNSDPNGRIIINRIKEYVENKSHKAIAFTSLGQRRYLSVLKHVDMIVGNSSSGIIEAPSFGIPTINIGDRQRGRVMPESVLNCPPKKDRIISAIKEGYGLECREKCKNVVNPYGTGNAAERIFSILQEKINKDIKLKKRFYDLAY